MNEAFLRFGVAQDGIWGTAPGEKVTGDTMMVFAGNVKRTAPSSSINN
jgi:hypothetical protein